MIHPVGGNSMRMLRFSLIIVGALTALSSAIVAHASVGQIVGSVFDEKSGDPLIGASVQLEGTTIGAACDIDGRYVIRNVPHGTHSLLIASLGYTPKRISEVAVTNGEPVVIDASLAESVTELKPIEVTAERARATESAVLIKRRGAIEVTDGMSAEMIKKAGDANAGDALRRVVGVSVVDGRKLVVRGMGGRYSGVELNGSALPSPEPEKREVPLDLFPAGLLDEVTTSKTFTPDKPGSFSGGLVDLTTKEFPSRLIYNVSVGQSYNSESTGKDMLSYDGGSLDWLGFDDGTRALPDVVAAGDWGYVANDDVQNAKNERAAESLSDVWSPKSRRALPNQSFAGNIGNTFPIGESSKLGVIGSLSYSNSYKIRSDLYAYPGAYTYGIDRGTQSVLWGSLVNVTFAAGDRNKLAMKGLYNRSADDEALTLFGVPSGGGADFVSEDRLRFSQRHIATLQLSGEHQVGFPFASTVEWRAQRAQAGQNEPDTRSNRFTYLYETEDSLSKHFEQMHYSGVHLYQNVDDDDAHFALDWTIPLTTGTKVKSGLLLQNKTRIAETHRYRLFSRGQAPAMGNGEDIFTADNIGTDANQYYLENLTFPDDPYDATEHTFASYAQLEADLIGGLRFIGGARREAYDVALHTGSRAAADSSVLVSRDEEDWMPMASLIYSFAEGSRLNGVVLRGVVSRTVSRPEFREMAPFFYQDLASGRPTFGNPLLVQCRVMNYDLRAEYFPSPGEVFAFTVFTKSFDKPIEQYVIGSGTSTLMNSYKNQREAQNYGFELEGRRRLAFLGAALSNLSLGGNVTRTFGEVTIDQNDLANPVEKRPLADQSEWAGNAFLAYESRSGGTDVTLNYNGFSKRLRYADEPGKEDWYQEPQHMLDLVMSHKLRANLSVKLAVKNILGAKYQLTQEQVDGNWAGTKQVLEEYELGSTYSIGFTYGI